MSARKPNEREVIKQPTMLIVTKDSFKKDLETRIAVGNELLNRAIATRGELEKSQEDYWNWDSFNSELLKQSFSNEANEYKAEYDGTNNFYGLARPRNAQRDLVKEFREKTNNKINSLQRLLARVDLIKSDSPERVVVREEPSPALPPKNNDVFIVHGHNNEVKVNVARTIEKLGLNPIILHEQANGGKTIIEKFEQHSNVGFAVVLLTEDDFGGMKGAEASVPRARQNVILEMGFFIGKLGRNRVCPLYIKGVELPSDLYGLLYIEIDASEHWRIKLAKELKAAGYDIDVNKII